MEEEIKEINQKFKLRLTKENKAKLNELEMGVFLSVRGFTTFGILRYRF